MEKAAAGSPPGLLRWINWVNISLWAKVYPAIQSFYLYAARIYRGLKQNNAAIELGTEEYSFVQRENVSFEVLRREIR